MAKKEVVIIKDTDEDKLHTLLWECGRVNSLLGKELTSFL